MTTAVAIPCVRTNRNPQLIIPLRRKRNIAANSFVRIRKQSIIVDSAANTYNNRTMVTALINKVTYVEHAGVF